MRQTKLATTLDNFWVQQVKVEKFRMKVQVTNVTSERKQTEN